jgi:hypothetical protein
MANQFKQVGALDGIAARQDENRHLQIRDLINEPFSLIGAKFQGVAIRLRGSAAMDASEVARLRDLPNGNKRLLTKIDRVDLRVHGPMRPHRDPNAQ